MHAASEERDWPSRKWTGGEFHAFGVVTQSVALRVWAAVDWTGGRATFAAMSGDETAGAEVERKPGGSLNIDTKWIIGTGIGIVAAILTTGVGLAALMVSLIGGVNTRIDDVRTDLTGQIDGVNTRIDDVRTDLTGQIGGVNTRIDDVRTDMREMRQDIRGMRAGSGDSNADADPPGGVNTVRTSLRLLASCLVDLNTGMQRATLRMARAAQGAPAGDVGGPRLEGLPENCTGWIRQIQEGP